MSKTLTIKACGCMVKRDSGGQVFIIYCSKHKAAPDMYEALEWAYRVHGDHGGPLGLGPAMAAALKKAKGE